MRIAWLREFEVLVVKPFQAGTKIFLCAKRRASEEAHSVGEVRFNFRLMGFPAERTEAHRHAT
jgi:hypothetical protein